MYNFCWIILITYRSASSKAGVRTEDNPAYGVSAPVYEMPQLSSASPDEVVYEGVL